MRSLLGFGVLVLGVSSGVASGCSETISGAGDGDLEGQGGANEAPGSGASEGGDGDDGGTTNSLGGDGGTGSGGQASDNGGQGSNTGGTSTGGQPQCSPRSMQLLQNPGFDETPELTGWSKNTTIGWELYLRGTDQTPLTPAVPTSTPYSLIMAGEHNISEEFFQFVDLPAGTFELTFSGQRMVILPAADDDDQVAIRLVDNGTELVDPFIIAATDDAPTTEKQWVEFSETVDASEFPSRIAFSMVATTDGGGYVSFGFDDLSLVARYVECE